ncbi:MAG: rRNA maturation RNase YbeY [Planctomycetia bacterium]
MGRRSGKAPEHPVSVAVADRQRCMRVGKPWLERLVRDVLAAEDVACAEISLVLTDNRRIGRLHADWFGDPSPTDVITFPLSEPGAAVLAGDLVVSTEMARRRGREFGWAARDELAYYVVHGLLHLTGHDDTASDRRRAMRARERAVMRAVGLPVPPRRRPGRSTA